jgi:hypothetical protein
MPASRYSSLAFEPDDTQYVVSAGQKLKHTSPGRMACGARLAAKAKAPIAGIVLADDGAARGSEQQQATTG